MNILLLSFVLIYFPENGKKPIQIPETSISSCVDLGSIIVCTKGVESEDNPDILPDLDGRYYDKFPLDSLVKI